MAPEQVAERKVGPASDIFSLGVVLFELLTGRVPFQGPRAEVLHRVVHDTCPRPSEFRPDLDRRLEAICLKALAKDPEERYRSMAELAMALEARAAPPRRRRRRLLGAVALGTVALGTVVIVAVALSGRPKAQTDQRSPDPPADGALTGEFRPAYESAGDFNPALFKPPPFKPAPFKEQPTTPEEWLAALDDDNVSNRYLAVLENARLKHGAAIPKLAERMNLSGIGGERARMGEHWSVRRECAAALGWLGKGSKLAEEALIERIADRVWQLPRTAPIPEADRWRNPFVNRTLGDPAYGGKGAALAALERIAPGRLKEALDRARSPRAEDKRESDERKVLWIRAVRAWAETEYAKRYK
jgi:hypothetical protein